MEESENFLPLGVEDRERATSPETMSSAKNKLRTFCLSLLEEGSYHSAVLGLSHYVCDDCLANQPSTIATFLKFVIPTTVRTLQFPIATRLKFPSLCQ